MATDAFIKDIKDGKKEMYFSAGEAIILSLTDVGQLF